MLPPFPSLIRRKNLMSHWQREHYGFQVGEDEIFFHQEGSGKDVLGITRSPFIVSLKIPCPHSFYTPTGYGDTKLDAYQEKASEIIEGASRLIRHIMPVYKTSVKPMVILVDDPMSYFKEFEKVMEFNAPISKKWMHVKLGTNFLSKIKELSITNVCPLISLNWRLENTAELHEALLQSYTQVRPTVFIVQKEIPLPSFAICEDMTQELPDLLEFIERYSKFSLEDKALIGSAIITQQRK